MLLRKKKNSLDRKKNTIQSIFKILMWSPWITYRLKFLADLINEALIHSLHFHAIPCTSDGKERISQQC